MDKWEKSEVARIDEMNKNHTAVHQTLLKNLREMQEDQNTVRKQRAGRADYNYNVMTYGSGTTADIAPVSAASSAAVAAAAAATGGTAMEKIAICLTRSVGCNNVPKLLQSNLHLTPSSTIGKSLKEREGISQFTLWLLLTYVVHMLPLHLHIADRIVPLAPPPPNPLLRIDCTTCLRIYLIVPCQGVCAST